MSHSRAGSQTTPRTSNRSTNSLPRRASGRTKAMATGTQSGKAAGIRSGKTAGTQSGRTAGKAVGKTTGSPRKENKGLPLPMKRLVRLLFRKSTGKSTGKGPGKSTRKNQDSGIELSRKALWAGGSVATLALLAIVPGKGTSQAIANATCQQVVKSGAEISRAQLASLISVPKGAAPEAVRQAINEPYCLLPVPDQAQSPKDLKSKDLKAEDLKTEETLEKVTTREAYPLAFDPEAWVIVNYSSGAYVDYDFVFKR
jgi:hypothetical protein